MPTYLQLKEMKRLIGRCRTYRQLAMVLLFMKTGIRLSELCNLNMGDVDTDNQVIRKRSGMGEKDREADIDEQLFQILNAYRIKYDLINVEPEHPFIS